MQKYVTLVDLVKIFPTSINLEKPASIQPRTSPSKHGGTFNSSFICLLSPNSPEMLNFRKHWHTLKCSADKSLAKYRLLCVIDSLAVPVAIMRSGTANRPLCEKQPLSGNFSHNLADQTTGRIPPKSVPPGLLLLFRGVGPRGQL